MNKRSILLAFSIAVLAASASSQVTGSGTSGTVPVFTGSSAIGNSNITQTTNGAVEYSDGLSTTSAATPLVANTVFGYNMATQVYNGWDVVDPSVTNPSTSSNSNFMGYLSTPEVIETPTDPNARTLTGGYFFPVFVASNSTTTNHLYGLNSNAFIGSSSNTAGFTSIYGGNFVAGIGPSVPASTVVTNVIGVDSGPFITSGSVTNAVSLEASPGFGIPGGPANLVIPNYFGLELVTPGLSNGATITNNFGVFQQDTSAKNYFAGTVGIGTQYPGKPLDVSGTIRTSAAGSDTGGVVYPDGSQQTTAWTGVLCGGDYAEDMRTSGDKSRYEPGDVLVLASGDDSDVQKSTEPYSAMVAGIYATKPGVVGRREAVAGSDENIPMAMVGVVPTRVSAENGPIHKGDLLVTSATMGYAMRGTDRSRMLGAVLGKAMGSLNAGKGVIEVLVTLQ